METITSKNHSIINHGTVCTFENDPLTIKFGLDNHLSLIFIFKEDGTKISKIQTSADSLGIELTLELYNFTNVLGVGNVTPIEIGVLNGKKLLINFRVYTFENNNTKTIHYTIYHEK